jgi:thiosulfate reductase/polysulfide reductase chain A
MFTTLADGMTRVYPGRTKGVLWYGYSILSFPQPDKMAEALKTVEFMAAVDILPADATYFADVLLPNAMYLEGNDLVERDYAAKMPQVVARQALVAPQFEAKTTGWICVELGKRLAPDFFKRQDGTWITPGEVLDEKLKRAGLAESFTEFKKTGFATKQATYEPATKFAAPGGKCQIYVPEFGAKGYDALPQWRPKRAEPTSEYPYYLVTYLPGVHKRNSTQNNRILNEIMPENGALINPSLAARLGIAEGQRIRIRSKDGAIELAAHLTETIRPDCVKIAHGFGHISPLLRAASGRGARDNDLIATQTPETMLAAGNFAGAGAIMDAVVRIEPV